MTRHLRHALACSLSALALPALAVDDLDALSLESAPPPAEAVVESPLRLAFEAGVGRIDPRGAADRDGRRASIDLRYSQRISAAWRLTLSDRLDHVHPAPFGRPATTNSLREAYAAWQEPGGSDSVEAGRINVRLGPAYGYNPTDYFRTGGLRAVTTADPVALREMRMGTVMLRATRLWPQGGVSLALAPKLDDDGADTRSSSIDLGATNDRQRAIATFSHRFSERVGAQASLKVEENVAPTVGISATALAADALVVYGEWAHGRQPTLLWRSAGLGPQTRRVHQAALGATYTFPSALAVTLEADYNGAGLDRGGWDAVLAQGPLAYARYAALTQADQELGSRRAWLLYATQKSLGLKQLDFTGFVRTNTVDDSRFAWAELRYHWPRWDLALQWQRASGRAGTEFGTMPYRQLTQLVAAFYL